jgi:DNA-binding response OmpR family regulator
MHEVSPVQVPQSILLVDDEQDILDILTCVLSGAGYSVDTATNGLEALRQVALRDYGLIITNLRMPVMNGKALYVELCARYPHLSKRVVFCTGDTAEPATERFLRACGAPVIQKPFALSAVLETVSRLLDKTSVPAGAVCRALAPPDAVTAPAI